MAGDPAELLPPLDFKHPGVPLRNYSGHQESIISAWAMDSSEPEQIRQMMESCDLGALKNQLEYFIRLSEAQAEQIKRYKNLQQRSHRLIQALVNKTAQPTSWKKANWAKAATSHNSIKSKSSNHVEQTLLC